jgi:hypothetical protein
MTLPSDPDYIPATTDQRVLQCEFYQELLSLNTDPYAAHSYDRGLIETVEEFARAGGES